MTTHRYKQLDGDKKKDRKKASGQIRRTIATSKVEQYDELLSYFKQQYYTNEAGNDVKLSVVQVVDDLLCDLHEKIQESGWKPFQGFQISVLVDKKSDLSFEPIAREGQEEQA